MTTSDQDRADHTADDADPGGDHDTPQPRPTGHVTDGAELEVRAAGANEPLQDAHPQLRPGDVGDPDAAPTEVGAVADEGAEERQALIDRVEEEREAD